MPVFSPNGDLIGVAQLVNKKKLGEFPKNDSASEIVSNSNGVAPDHFQASFDESDQKYMQIFNNQAGVILQNAELLAALTKQKLSLQDSLSATSASCSPSAFLRISVTPVFVKFCSLLLDPSSDLRYKV